MRMLGERPAITFLGVLVVALALALPGCVFMLTQALRPAVSRLPAAEITAYVAPGTGASEVKALAARLEAIEGVARVKLIPRDQAWAELQRRARDNQALAEVKPNPLPDAIVVEFAPRLASASVDTAVAAVAKQPRVESVQADLEWYRRVLVLIQTTTNLLLPVAAIVALLVLVVVLGLIRSVAVVDAAELRLLDQIGAEVEFMRRPFVYAGATLLGISAAACLGLLALACMLANPALAELGRRFGFELQLGYPPWPLIVSFVAASLLIGASAGSSFGAKQIALAKRH